MGRPTIVRAARLTALVTAGVIAVGPAAVAEAATSTIGHDISYPQCGKTFPLSG
jgi:hypothetical protein